MQKRLIAGVLSCFIALLAAGAVSLVTSQWDTWGAPNNGLQDIICNAESNLPAQSTLETAQQMRKERVRLDSPSAHLYHSPYFPVSNGFPATLARDLLTFVQQRAT